MKKLKQTSPLGLFARAVGTSSEDAYDHFIHGGGGGIGSAYGGAIGGFGSGSAHNPGGYAEARAMPDVTDLVGDIDWSELQQYGITENAANAAYLQIDQTDTHTFKQSATSLLLKEYDEVKKK